MKRPLLPFALLLPILAPAAPADPAPALEPFAASSPQSEAAQWTSDYPAALERARQEQRLVLLNFTGKDWCIWCHRLRDQILVQPPFLAFARERLVLVELDFPRAGTQPAAVKEQNRKLKEKFGVKGYPTVILVDAEGRELGRTGYMQGGPKTFVRELKRLGAPPPPAP